MTTDTKLSLEFDNEFQKKVLVALSTDLPFLEQVSDILKPAYFDSEGSQWIVNEMMEYHRSHKGLVTDTVIRTQVKHELSDTDSRLESVKEAFKYMFREATPTDLGYVKEKFLEFCKYQELKNAFHQGIELLNNHDVSTTGKELVSLFNKANQAGMSRDLGHLYHDGLDARISQSARKVIPTPWPVINNIMDGGLGAGELGCIIAPTGIGKSWLLSAIGQHAMTLGFTVAHYTLELSEHYVGLRYDAIMTGIAPTKIKNNVEHVRSMMANVPGKSYIKYFPMRTVTVQAVISHMKRMSSFGDPAHMCILDYGDLLRSQDRHNAKHEELGAIYEEIRGSIAGEFQIPTWTASQAQRSAAKDEVVEGDKVAGSYAKTHVCDFIMSVNRTLDDKASGTTRVHIPKNRNGPDGMTFPAIMDLENVRIEIFDPLSEQGQEILAKSQDDFVPIKAKAFDPARNG